MVVEYHMEADEDEDESKEEKKEQDQVGANGDRTQSKRRQGAAKMDSRENSRGQLASCASTVT